MRALLEALMRGRHSPHPINGHHAALSTVIVARTGDLPTQKGRWHGLAIYRGLDRLTARSIARRSTQRKGYLNG